MTMAILLTFSLVAMGVISLALGVETFINEERKNTANRAFCFLTVAAFFWCVGYAWMTVCELDKYAYYARALGLFGVYLFLPGIVYFAAVVGKVPGKYRKALIAIFAIAGFVCYGKMVNKENITLVSTSFGTFFVGNHEKGRVLHLCFIGLVILIGMCCILYGKKNAILKREKSTIDKLIVTAIVLVISTISDTILPAMGYQAFPSSCFGIFVGILLVNGIAKKNNTFALASNNITEYILRTGFAPILLLNPALEIEKANSGAFVYFEDLDFGIGKKVDMLFENSDVFVEGYKRQVSKVKDYGKYNLTAVPGHAFCEVEVNVIYDKYNEPYCAIMYIRDMTKELHYIEQIESSKEEALQANMAKSDFLSNMSHEIRTPINAILGMNEMIIRECEDKEILSYANNIQMAGKSLLSLVNDVLDFSKIESGKMELIENEYSSRSLINDLVNMISLRAEEKKLAFEMEVDSRLPVGLRGDETRIRQVIINLLTNAVKYTQEGFVQLTVRLLSAEHNEAVIRVEVKDSGVGIRQEDRDKLFESFKRIDENKNRTIEGTGLGLSITTKLLKLMGSQLDVESTYGEGSTFAFTIAQKITDRSELGDYKTAYNQSKEGTAKKEVFEAPEARVLIVDDNLMNLQVAKGLLKDTKMKVDTADTGKKALEIIANKHYDIIFMDHLMPEMDGIETLHLIKKIEENPCEDTPIIALTANAVVGAKEQYIEEGFSDYLSKPIEVVKLYAMVQKYLPSELITKNIIQ